MKTFLIVLALTFFVFSVSAQTESTFTYSEDTILAPASRADYDWFGSPCLSGDMMMIGGSISAAVCGVGSGAGYVNYYVKNIDGDWNFIQKIESPEPEDCDHFGSDIAIDGDWAFIGAWWDDNNTYTDVGKVYRFQKVGGTWVHTPPDLYCPNPSNEDMFGVSLEIKDGLAFIGALKDDIGRGFESGTVYYYTVTSPGTLTPQGFINAPSAMGHDAGDNFGSDIGYYDSTLVISAYRDDSGGCAFIFRPEGGSWDCKQKITGSDTEFGDGWGEGIDIDRGIILSGAFLDSAIGMEMVGSAYAYTENTSGTWVERAIFRPADANPYDYFGSRVSLENGVAAIGAFKRDEGTTDGGAVYFYSVNKSYSVNYLAGPNGSISGDTSQTVNHGDSSATVTAIPDMGYAFIDWSDKSTDNPRTDYNITSAITVTANFDTVIINIPVSDVEIIGAADITANNGTLQLGVNILPVDATDKTVTWSSTAPSIATVNDTGLVTAVANGDIKIMAAANDGSGEADSVDINVSGQTIPVIGVSIFAVDTITVGETITLIADISPYNATIKSVRWNVDNSNIASIDTTSGILTGIAAGEVVVTVTTEDGSKTASKKIIVVAATSVVTFANEQFKIYPNPSAGTLIVENKGISENADFLVSVYNLSGICIHKEHFKEYKLSIQLRSGFYLFKISDGLTESTRKIFMH